MVIVKLLGGLGNQMFQYAFGKNIALKRNCELKLDLTFYEDTVTRRYELDHFFINAKKASLIEIEMLKLRHNSKINRIGQRLFNTKPYLIHQKNLEFNAVYFKTQRDIYLDGYWQSEKFFIDAAAQIMEDFKIKTPPTPANANILSEINSGNSVSLHIRRGDFQTNETFNRIHGICSLNYYQEASVIIGSKIADPVFYIFSDDLQWAKQNLKLNYEAIFVDINDEATAYADLRLISNCKHHILANSSFSWWGAWLNPNPLKTVIAPKSWFADRELNQQSENIVPESWIRI